jgi:hypothetical protein
MDFRSEIIVERVGNSVATIGAVPNFVHIGGFERASPILMSQTKAGRRSRNGRWRWLRVSHMVTTAKQRRRRKRRARRERDARTIEIKKRRMAMAAISLIAR